MDLKFCLWVTVVGCILINEAFCDSDMKCSAKDNEYYNVKKGRCKPCRRCKSGTARNFSEEYAGPHSLQYGDTECLPCRPPPDGYFVETNSGDRYLIKCKDCASLNRKTDHLCDRTSDASCGSCLPGYEDRYGTTNQNCVSQPTPDQIAMTDTTDATNTSLVTIDIKGPNTGAITATTDRDSGMTSLEIIIAGSVISVLIVIICTLVILKRCKDIQRQKRKQDAWKPQSVDTSIEIDAADLSTVAENPSVSTPSGEHIPLVPGSGTLCSEIPVHSELNQSLPSIRYQQITPINSDPPRYIGCEEDCSGCCTLSSCSCRRTQRPELDRDYTFGAGIRLTGLEEIDILGVVASNVCHCPMPLFRYIGVPHSAFYRTSADRQANPENMSRKEFIRTNLKEWANISHGSDATLQKLLIGLYKAKFYGVVDEILKIREVQQLEQTFVKDVVPDNE